MSIQRRKRIGKPLLVATAGVGLTVSSCTGKEGFGNLMPPPTEDMVELCIDVTPDNADVTVQGVPVADEECIQTYQGTHIVEATSEGYEDYTDYVDVTNDMTHTFEMTQSTDDSGTQ